MLLTYEEALNYMQGLRRFGIKLGNARFEALLERLGNPHRQYAIAHVAGTKGKGSTTALIANVLTAHGFRTGSYYSPYVYDVRERVKIDGVMISREDFARHVSAIKPHIEALSETELGQTTEFELKTAVGFLHFAEQGVDFAAIEVGIGGRLDATNVVSPLATVITNIGLDHTAMLGDTHAKIAFEKAGIIKPGIACITATDEQSALAVIRQTAEERSARLLEVCEGTCSSRRSSEPFAIHWQADEGETFTVCTPRYIYHGLRTGLRGTYQRANAACAIGALELLAEAKGFAIEEAALNAGLEETVLPGRMQIVRSHPTLLMDGAHNAMAAQALREEIGRIPHNRLLLVIGMVTGHDPEDVVGVLAPLATKVYATQPTWNKGHPAAEIAAAAQLHCSDVQVITPPLAATRTALADAAPDDLVLVSGSFYVVGDVRPEDLLALKQE